MPESTGDTRCLCKSTTPGSHSGSEVSVARLVCRPEILTVHARCRPVALRISDLTGPVEARRCHSSPLVVRGKHATLHRQGSENLVGSSLGSSEAGHIARVAHILDLAVHRPGASDAVLGGSASVVRLKSVPGVVWHSTNHPVVTSITPLVVVLIMRLDGEAVHHSSSGQRERDSTHSGGSGTGLRRLHFVGREGRAADFAGQEQVAGRDEHLALARASRDAALPAQNRLRSRTSELLVLHLQVIVKRTPQRDGGRESRGRQVVVRLPPINDEAVVNPQLDAFVGLSDASLESENFGRSVVRVIEKLQETSPPHREALLVGKAQVAKAARDSVVESALRIRDIKVDLILLPRRHWLGELHVIVVRGVQARALRQARVDLVVSLDSWRVGDFVARAQGEQPARGDDRRCVRRRVVNLGLVDRIPRRGVGKDVPVG
mmetsp:Transcript_34887/g.82191  ORF Transcript_34887/g.82191 Transcript_34887/m.82191 type:complete len:434 (+) Transcript_34887:9891-11192(+)